MYHFTKKRYASHALQKFVAQNISFDIEYLKQAFKNYQGRHNQETHTTLYNIAHPAQGKSSQGAANAVNTPKDIYRQAGIRGLREDAGAGNGLRIVVGDNPKFYGEKIYNASVMQPNGSPVRGTPISPSDKIIPNTVFHVTTNLPAILSSGKILAGGKGGLGGDNKDQIVSTTISKSIATQLLRDLKFSAYIARLSKGDVDTPERAASAKVVLGALVNEMRKTGWGQKDIKSFLEQHSYQHLQKSYRATDYLRSYFMWRIRILGKINPIIFSDDAQLKAINPKNMGVVHVPKSSLLTGAMVTNFDIGNKGGLEELRIYGDVPVGKGAVTTKEKVTKNVLVTTFKNYQGRHNQETHTTLYNIAHPSQGRVTGSNQSRASGNELTRLGRLVAKAPSQTLTAAWAAKYVLDSELARSSEIAVNASRAQILARVRKELPTNRDLRRFIDDASRRYFGFGYEQEKNKDAIFGAVMEKYANAVQMWKRDLADLREAGAEDGAAYQSVSRAFANASQTLLQYEAVHILLLRNDKTYAKHLKKLEEREYHKKENTIIKNVVWDGASTSPLDFTRIQATPIKAVAAGEATKIAIKTEMSRHGVPEKLVVFPSKNMEADLQLFVSASHNSDTNKFNFYPHLIQQNTNTNIRLADIVNHEVSHSKYVAVSLASRIVADIAKQPSKFSGLDALYDPIAARAADRYFTPQMQQTIRQPSFLGTPYEQRLLQALTNPKSIIKVDRKTGKVTAKSSDFEEFVALFKSDGVTDYSASFWRAFTVLPSQHTLNLAINETLAEVSAMSAHGLTSLIPKGWVAASQLMDSVFAKLGSPYPDTSAVVGMRYVLDRHTSKGKRIKTAQFASTALKNYQGRHNQETHTTLYNIAHPSQGRGGRRAASAADTPKDIYRQAGIRGLAEPLSRTISPQSRAPIPAGETTHDISQYKPETGWRQREAEINYEMGLNTLVQWYYEDKTGDLNAWWGKYGYSPNDIAGFKPRTQKQDLDDALDERFAVTAFIIRRPDPLRTDIANEFIKRVSSSIYSFGSDPVRDGKRPVPNAPRSLTLDEQQKAYPASGFVIPPASKVSLVIEDTGNKGESAKSESRPVTREMLERGEKLFYQTAREIEGRVFSRAKKLISNSPIAIAIPPEGFSDFIRTGKYKNLQHRVEEYRSEWRKWDESTKGMTQDQRSASHYEWEKRISQIHPEMSRVMTNGTYDPAARSNLNRENHGITSSRGDDHPISGYVQTAGARNEAAQYGLISLVLKSDVKQRASISFGDSWGETLSQSFIASPSGGVTRGSIGASIFQLARSSDKDTQATDSKYGLTGRRFNENARPGLVPKYVEAQIFGGVTPKDVASIVIKDLPNQAKYKQVEDWAKTNGIKIEYAAVANIYSTTSFKGLVDADPQ